MVATEQAIDLLSNWYHKKECNPQDIHQKVLFGRDQLFLSCVTKRNCLIGVVILNSLMADSIILRLEIEV